MKVLDLFSGIGGLSVDEPDYIKTLKIVPVSRSSIQHWLMNVHYARRLPSCSFAFLLMNGYEEIGAISIGKPATQQ